jgi:hypothetical protein
MWYRSLRLYRQVKRYFLNVLTTLSLLLCVATAVLWVRSWRAGDYVACQGIHAPGVRGERSLIIASSAGRLHVRRLRVHLPAFTAEELAEFNQHAGVGAEPSGFQWRFGVRRPVPHGFLGFHLDRTDEPQQYRFAGGHQKGRREEFNLTVPHWLLVVLSAAMPARAAVTGRRRRILARRLRLGRCLLCGYDLRATPGTCPECGSPVSTTPA